MRGKRPPSGRECALAQASLATINEREQRGTTIVASAAPANAPALAMWGNVRQGAVRLINLERRARFARLAI